VTRVIPPGEGERRAQRGYGRQYESAAAAIYAALDNGELVWVGLADRTAGIADDVVLGLRDRVVGHQFKASQFPEKFNLSTLLTGPNGLIRPLVEAWKALKAANADSKIEIRLVTNDYPSTRDAIGDMQPGHSAAFLAEFELYSDRSLVEWRATGWNSFIDSLHQASGLKEVDFEQFLKGFRLLHGSAADFIQLHRLSPEAARLARQIAGLLPRLVADPRDKDRWTRSELLHELKWRDSAITRHEHRFPVGAYVQRNVYTEEALRESIRAAQRGYVSLVGPPGAGKSTLLQTALATESGLLVVRYLAYVPGVGQGVGRGEADDFLEDVSTQLKNSGLAGVRFRDETLDERRQHFGALLRQAGERYAREKVRTLIVVDGLDHVPREEKPQRSFLEELPLPNAVPEGVLFVLGTQRIDLQDLKAAVRDQASKSERMVSVQSLKPEAVYRMADLLKLDPSTPRERLFEISRGHPLVTRYLIESLRDADEPRRAAILAGSMPFEGDLEAVYEAVWHGIKDDDQACNVLGYIARAEGSIDLELLAKSIPEPAIESALRATKHLLNENKFGWSVFHNSFRLFILDKPRLRLGKPDLDYSPRIYRDLALLAQSAPNDTPQRWLELRYLARANDDAGVLELAQAARFRRQLAEGRSVSELEADVRLALGAAKRSHDGTVVMRLLLARDELGRRSSALQETTSLTAAMLAVGDISAAQAFVEEYGNQGYEVVDALMDAGEISRAKILFDKLEPIQQLLSGRLNTQNISQNRSEFKQWARRVAHFRDIEQINLEIDRLSNAGLGPLVVDRGDAEKQLAANLRETVAISIMISQIGADPAEVALGLKLPHEVIPNLLTHAAIGAQTNGSTALAMVLIRRALAIDDFSDISNATRRHAAVISARAGETDIAQSIFATLSAPSIAAFDDVVNESAPESIARAVLEHAEITTLLGHPLADVAQSKRALLRPLQLHANRIGILLAKARTARGDIRAGELARAAKAALMYLTRVKAHGGDEFYAMRQIALATPVLGRALIRAAVLCGEEEFDLVLAEFDRIFEPQKGTSQLLKGLQRETVIAVYRIDGDTAGASRRLEPLVSLLQESTPTAQLDGLAELAIAFAEVGNHARARELLTQVHGMSLGYALAPKKDPQYAVWRELLTRASSSHPDGRYDRVALLMRQLSGMAETEGRSSAYRLASAIITEAGMCDGATGLAAARVLSDQGMIGWPNLVDALLLGTIRRRPELATIGGIAWCSLVLPYYTEPYYHESHLGDFIEAAVSLVEKSQLDSIVEMFCSAIEAESRAHERFALLQTLSDNARKRGHTSGALSDALQRWSLETLPPRTSYTPIKYDSIASLSELDSAFRNDAASGGLGYEAPRAFERLARDAGFENAREVFERWPVLQRSSGSRFVFVDLALDAGNQEYARQLISQYERVPDEWGTWTVWSGGGTLRYFRAKLKVEGEAVHARAFENFVMSLIAGREIHTSVMLEIEDILPVITNSPDWRAIWDLLAEQLVTTREHGIGTDFAVADRKTTDEEVIAILFRWALVLPLAELQRQSCVGLLRLNGVPLGRRVFANAVLALLSGEGDEPALAIQLLLLDTSESMLTELQDAVVAFASHPDYAVSEGAMVLSNRWQMPAKRPKEALPSFYWLVLENQNVEDFEPPTLADRDSGAMRVESPLGWTSMFPVQVEALAKGRITPAHIRHRCGMFIDQWGGLEVYGQSATDKLQSDLARLEMRMPFWRPHVMVAARALRYVAGELSRGGILPIDEVPFLLHAMSFPAPTLALIAPVPRPTFIRRPTLDENNWRDKEIGEEWLQGVERDVVPYPQDETTIADVSTFQIHKISRGRYRSERIRIPFLDLAPETGLDEWLAMLPEAVWADGFRTSTDLPSEAFVRRLSVRYMPDLPRFQLVICPNWLRQLGWRVHPDNWLVYLDRSGQVVARAVWWRDAGPVDLGDDAIWGEGVYLSVTPSGLSQIEVVRGTMVFTTYARREAESERDADERVARNASRPG
jgi:hypothetical protein